MRNARFVLGMVSLMACGGGKSLTPEEQALTQTKSFIQSNLDDLHAAAVKLQSDAPAPDADGWSAGSDPHAVSAMKADWKKARLAYEHIEASIGLLFRELDVSTDERYDGFLANLGADDNLFDDQGVTGIHALERILWSDSIPQAVVDHEKTSLPGYVAAAFPSNAVQAGDFKDKLCGRLVRDIESMRAQFTPLALDPPAAYRGVIDSMHEQLEKVEMASEKQGESRYAQYTLADMRANVEAGEETQKQFETWLLQKGGQAESAAIAAGFARLKALYAAFPGDEVPPLPDGWSSKSPTDSDLATPFGKLWKGVSTEASASDPDSLVSRMNLAAQKMGIAEAPK